jgi:hypothetical protein
MRAHLPKASKSYLEIGALPASELASIMARGEPPSEEALAGWEWRGLNTMGWAKLAGIKKFVKGFYQDDDGLLWGYNEPIVQNALEEPWSARPNDAEPKRFGFYRVVKVDPESRDNRHLNSLLLDYGLGKNPWYDASRGLRDYLVRVEAGSDELLLGEAWYALGALRIRVPRAYFVLERHRPTSFKR